MLYAITCAIIMRYAFVAYAARRYYNIFMPCRGSAARKMRLMSAMVRVNMLSPLIDYAYTPRLMTLCRHTPPALIFRYV